MKIISGMNSLRSLGDVGIREKFEDLDKPLMGAGNIVFLLRKSKAGNMIRGAGSVVLQI